MFVLKNSNRRPLRAALCALFLMSVIGGAMAQQGASGPWPFFQQGPQRKGGGFTAIPAQTNGNQVVSPRNRWNFPHLIPNRTDPSKPLTWNLGHITASTTIGNQVGGGNTGDELFAASFDRFKVELPLSSGTLPDLLQPDIKYQLYSLQTYGTVWGIPAQKGPAVNALTPDWWWGYRDAQVEFHTFESLRLGTGSNPNPDDSDTSADPSSGIYLRHIPGGDAPNVSAVTVGDANAGRVPAGKDPFTFREFQFLRMISRSIPLTYPDAKIDPNRKADELIDGLVVKGGNPPSPIRSTPSYFHLSQAFNYTVNQITDVNDLNNLDALSDVDTPQNIFQTRPLQHSTTDVIVFGADDGFIYCLDASQANMIPYSWTDPEGQTHSTRIASLIWRFNTMSLLNKKNGEVAEYTQVISSPLIANLGGDLGTVAVVGTGTGRAIALDARTGVLKRSVTTSYLVNATVTTPAGVQPIRRQWAAVRTSPALYTGGGQPVVVFGADDGIAYAWNITTQQASQADPFVWRFYTGDDPSPSDPTKLDRTGLNNPPILASPLVLESGEAEAAMVIVCATGRKVLSENRNGLGAGMVYALNPATGKALWDFGQWYDLEVADPANPNNAGNLQNQKAATLIGSVKASPAYSSNINIFQSTRKRVLFVKSEDGNMYALYTDPAIAKDDLMKDQARMAWTIPVQLGGTGSGSANDLVSSPVVSLDGTVYLGTDDGRIRGFRTNTSGPIRLDNNLFSTVVYPQADAVWQFAVGTLKVTGVNPKTNLQTYDLSVRPIIASPAISRDFLYVAADGAIFAYQDTNGGTLDVVNDFFTQTGILPTQSEQPSTNVANPEEEATRLQAEIVDATTFASLTEGAGDNVFSHGSSIAGGGWNARTPGRLEWGDTVYVAAWNLDETVKNALATLRLQGPNGTVQVNVPVRKRTSTSQPTGKQGFAKYAFVLDPFTPEIVNPNGGGLMANPFFGNPLTPGGEGSPTWTVVGVQTSAGVGGTGGAALSSNTASTLAKFKLNNPLELFYPTQGGASVALTQQHTDDIALNGNFYVPVMTFTDGHHNTTTPVQTIVIGDRSNLRKEIPYNATSQTGSLPPGIAAPQLRVRYAPAEMQWLGGPRAVYKPLFNSAPGLASAAPTFSSLALITDEVPPESPGRPNYSPDYPNIPAAQMDFRDPLDNKNLVQQDVLLPGKTGALAVGYPTTMTVHLPKYQPANVVPLGRGYATINPANKFTLDILTSPSPTYLPQYPSDTTYLTRIYVDTNKNNAADFNEAFRAMITGTQVEADESIDVAEQTVDLPGQSPFPNIPSPPGIAHGFVPYARYRAVSGGGNINLLRAESPFFQPVTILNTGNVNLWNVRMAKDPRQVPSMVSQTVDQNIIQSGNFTQITGAIGAGNLQSTLDLDPTLGNQYDKPFFWMPVQKPRVNAPEGNRLKMIDPFTGSQSTSPVGGVPSPLQPGVPPDTRARVSVGVPIGAPVGKYSTQPIFFEDGKFVGQPSTANAEWLVGADGLLNPNTIQSGSFQFSGEAFTRKPTVTVDVMEARVSAYLPLAFPANTSNAGGKSTFYFPASNDDPNGILDRYPEQLPFSLGSGGVPVRSNPQELPVSNAAPVAYRDSAGVLHAIWATNRTDQVGNSQWQMVSSTLNYTLPGALNPWGWLYQNPQASTFWSPGFNSFWWSNPVPLTTPATTGNFSVFGSPAVVTDSTTGQTYLFFQGTQSAFSDTNGAQHINRVFYLPLDKNGNPGGNLLSFPWDQEVSIESPRPFIFDADNGQRRLGLVWDGGTPNRWKLFISTIGLNEIGGESGGSATSKWTKPVILPTPAGLSYAIQPSPFFKAKSTKQGSFIDVAYSGFNRSEQNVDLYLNRFIPNADFTQWTAVPLPSVKDEVVRRLPGRPEYVTRGVDWVFTDQFREAGSTTPPAPMIIHWVRPTGAVLDFTTPDATDSDTGIRTYTQANYTVTVDPSSGQIRFSSPNPGRFPLPSGNDRIVVSYTPSAYRFTTDSRADTQPIYFIDRSPETITAAQPYKVKGQALPAYIPRDRMWIIWRKGSADTGGGSPTTNGPGAVNATSLWYTTYRLMAVLPTSVPISQAGDPQITVTGNNGPFTISPGGGTQPGRVFFTELDEGNQNVFISTGGPGSGTSARNFSINWQPERVGVQNQEVQVPMKLPVNEGQVWAFKDPFSYVPPSDSNYIATSNNNIWLFWSSSRAGTSDVYYQVISPQL